MKYSKKEIGEELKKELDKGYNIERISSWACDLLYIKMRNRPSSEIGDILDRISLMGAGPEFEYTEQELGLLADRLINEYIKTPDSSIVKSATQLDNIWLMCPDCIDAWESTTKDAMVICPKCNKAFRNPRHLETEERGQVRHSE
jgi:hypothetical protein